MDPITKRLITLALKEDLGPKGDLTSKAILGNLEAKAVLKLKCEAVLFGQEIFKEVFRQVDKRVSISFLYDDGIFLAGPCLVAELAGKASSILKAERTALNFLCFLSGIATQTRHYVEEARKYGATRILDTRKTLPGLRLISKAAVRAGGGENHRFGLYDMVLIKDNHIDAAGSIRMAVQAVRRSYQKRYKVEVECRNLAEVKEALEAGVDRIMLDNMSQAELAACLKEIAGRVETEVSGGVGLEDLKRIVPLNPTYISCGSLTHSVKSVDFSLDIVP